MAHPPSHAQDVPAEEVAGRFTFPVRLLEHDGLTIRFKADIFDNDVPLDKSYMPYFNSLLTVVVYRLDSAMSLKNVPNWYHSSLQYNNLSSTNALIVGYADETFPVVTRKDVDATVNPLLGTTVTATTFSPTPRSIADFKKTFYRTVMDVYNREFPPAFVLRPSGSHSQRGMQKRDPARPGDGPAVELRAVLAPPAAAREVPGARQRPCRDDRGAGGQDRRGQLRVRCCLTNKQITRQFDPPRRLLAPTSSFRNCAWW